jgi:hypothetical protein
MLLRGRNGVAAATVGWTRAFAEPETRKTAGVPMIPTFPDEIVNPPVVATRLPDSCSVAVYPLLLPFVSLTTNACPVDALNSPVSVLALNDVVIGDILSDDGDSMETEPTDRIDMVKDHVLKTPRLFVVLLQIFDHVWIAKLKTVFVSS